MVEEKSVTTILREAADLIEKHGLGRERRDLEGRLCVHGALAKVAFGSPYSDEHDMSHHPLLGQYIKAWNAVGGRLGKRDGKDYSLGIADWSNRAKKEDVVRELIETADELELVV